MRPYLNWISLPAVAHAFALAVQAPRAIPAPTRDTDLPWFAWREIAAGPIRVDDTGTGTVEAADEIRYNVLNGVVQDFGKYERCAPWIVLAHDSVLDGRLTESCYEMINGDSTLTADLMEVDTEDRYRWHLNHDTYGVVLYYSEQGFVDGEELTESEYHAKLAKIEEINGESDEDEDDPNVDKVTLPAFWCSGLVNGDWTSFDLDPAGYAAERARAQAEERRLADEGWSIVDCGDAYFTTNYQWYDPGADCTGGDVCDYTIMRTDPDYASNRGVSEDPAGDTRA